MVPPTCLAASKTTASAPRLRSANASESPEMPPPTMAITPEPHRESHSCSSPDRPQRPHTQRRRLNFWPSRSKDSAGLLRGRENPLYATRRPDLALTRICADCFSAALRDSHPAPCRLRSWNQREAHLEKNHCPARWHHSPHLGLGRFSGT